MTNVNSEVKNDRKEGGEAVRSDVSSPVSVVTCQGHEAGADEAGRLACFNRVLESALMAHGFGIGAEAYVEEGVIKTRVVVGSRPADNGSSKG